MKLSAIKNKRGQDWTVGKLLAVIMTVVVVALVIYGLSTGALNPLFQKIGAMFNNVLMMMGLKKDVGSSTGCTSDFVPIGDSEFIKIVGDGSFQNCGTYCKIVLDKNIDVPSYVIELGYDVGTFLYDLEEGSLQYWKEGRYSKVQEKLLSKDISLSVKEKTIYDLLKRNLRTSGEGKLRSGLGGNTYNSIEFRVGSEDFVWDDKGKSWAYTKKRAFLFGGDIEIVRADWTLSDGINKIHDSSSGGILPDTKVYWELRDSGSPDYSLIPGMKGDQGEIDDSNDFEIFKNWFNGLIETQRRGAINAVTQESIATFVKDDLKSPTINVNGKDEKLGIDSSETYYPILYFSPENKQYGLQFSSDNKLKLMIYNSSLGNWVVASTPLNLLEAPNDLMSGPIIKTSKIKDYISKKCKEID
ncbi:MAG: hypothetical protein WCP89_00755 [archaeon]